MILRMIRVPAGEDIELTNVNTICRLKPPVSCRSWFVLFVIAPFMCEILDVQSIAMIDCGKRYLGFRMIVNTAHSPTGNYLASICRNLLFPFL